MHCDSDEPLHDVHDEWQSAQLEGQKKEKDILIIVCIQHDEQNRLIDASHDRSSATKFPVRKAGHDSN